jgi:hypothetical protein
MLASGSGVIGSFQGSEHKGYCSAVATVKTKQLANKDEFGDVLISTPGLHGVEVRCVGQIRGSCWRHLARPLHAEERLQ